MENFPKCKIIYIKRNEADVSKSISNFDPEEWYGKNYFKYQILA